MTSMTRTTVGVTGGVDTHGQSHHAAVIDHLGRQLGDREFSASPAGYGALVVWLQGHGELDRVGVDTPFARHLQALDPGSRLFERSVRTLQPSR